MKTLKIVGNVDEQHHLSALVPSEIPPGPVQILLAYPEGNEEDEAGAEWATGIAREWGAEMSDSREDVYSLSDGKPIEDRR